MFAVPNSTDLTYKKYSEKTEDDHRKSKQKLDSILRDFQNMYLFNKY